MPQNMHPDPLQSRDTHPTAPVQLYYTGLRVADGNGSDWAVVFYPASSSLWRYPAADLSPCNGTVPGERGWVAGHAGECPSSKPLARLRSQPAALHTAWLAGLPEPRAS